MEFSETSSRRHASLVTVHGFRVESYGKRLSPGFKRGLRLLAERDFDDPTCVVVTTTSGNQSGITHAGGRCVAPDNPYRTEVMRQMRELGMEPPPPPFILTPGEYTLYHEWGHHVDRTWSGDNQEVVFSFRWLSRFYTLSVLPPRIAYANRAFPVDSDDFRPIESDVDAGNAVVLWWHASSELFADLFEDWMRGEKKVGWDHCEPKNLNASEACGHPFVRISLLPGLGAEDVRAIHGWHSVHTRNPTRSIRFVRCKYAQNGWSFSRRPGWLEGGAVVARRISPIFEAPTPTVERVFNQEKCARDKVQSQAVKGLALISNARIGRMFCSVSHLFDASDAACGARSGFV